MGFLKGSMLAAMTTSLVVLTGCLGGNEEVTLLEEELRTVSDEYREKIKEKKDLARQETALEKKIKKLPKLEQEEAELKVKTQPLLDYEKQVAEAVESVNKELEVWRSATRDSFKKLNLGTLTTIDGNSYENAVVENVTDDGVTILSNGNSVTVPFEQMDMRMRLNFVHEPTVIASESK